MEELLKYVSLGSNFASLFSSIGTGGWIGIGVAAAAIAGIWFYAVKKNNERVDGRDMTESGAHVGDGAVDLRNQLDRNWSRWREIREKFRNRKKE